METKGNDPASPLDGVYAADALRSGNHGMTKREHFAAMAMQGYCGGEFTGQSGMDVSDIAKWSVNMADALIEALNKSK